MAIKTDHRLHQNKNELRAEKLWQKRTSRNTNTKKRRVKKTSDNKMCQMNQRKGDIERSIESFLLLFEVREKKKKPQNKTTVNQNVYN